MTRPSAVALLLLVVVALSCQPTRQPLDRGPAPNRELPPGAIVLPDSLGGIAGPRDIALDEAAGTLYVAGAGGIAVIDAATGQRTAVISMPDVFELWLNPVSGRLYAGGAVKHGGAISVIDCASGKVLKTDTVGRAWPSCLNPGDNKIYARYYSGWGERLAVFDGASGRLLQSLDLGRPEGWDEMRMLWSAAAGAAYCESDDRIVVVDGQTDRVRARLRARTPLCDNPATGKLYAADDACVAVVDCRTDSIVKWVGATCHLTAGVCDPVTGKVYVGGTSLGRTPGTDVTIIDGAADTVLASIPVLGDVSCLLLDSAGARVFCVGQDRVTVVDCRTDSVVGIITPDSRIRRAVYFPPARRIYGIESSASVMVVIDCARLALADPVTLGCRTGMMLLDPDSDQLYCADAGSGSLLVIDAATGVVAEELRTGPAPTALAFGRRGVIHCAVRGDNVVRTLDPVTGRVLAELPVIPVPRALCYSPRSNRLFCLGWTENGYNAGDSSVLTIIDCWTNVVLKRLRTAGSATLFAYDSVRDRVYWAGPIAPMKTGTSTCVEGLAAGTLDRVLEARFPGHPRSLCYDVGRNHLYCARGREFGLAAVDCATGTVTGRIKAGQAPTALVLNPLLGRLYCVGPEPGITVLDARTDSIAGFVRVPAAPSALRWVPGSNRLYCSCPTVDSVVVIDCATDRVVARLAAGHEPGAIEYSPKSRTVFIAGSGSGLTRISDEATPGYPR